jgi:hypothetical protein
MSGDVEKRLTDLEDAEQINKLHQNYMNLMDYLDYESVMDLFTEEATAEVRDSGVKRWKKEKTAETRYALSFGLYPTFSF